MTLDQLDRAIKAGATDEEIMAANDISETALRMLKGRLKEERPSEEERKAEQRAKQKQYSEKRRAAARNGNLPAPAGAAAPKVAAKEVLAVTDSMGAYWAGFFDALGSLEVKTGPDGLCATARFSCRKEAQVERFIQRYGGDKKGGDKRNGALDDMFAVILTDKDDGMQRLITDLASESRLFKERAASLLQWIELKFYMVEQEKLLREQFKA